MIFLFSQSGTWISYWFVAVLQQYLVNFSLPGSFYIIHTLQKDYKQVSVNTKPNRNIIFFKTTTIHKVYMNIAIVIL